MVQTDIMSNVPSNGDVYCMYKSTVESEDKILNVADYSNAEAMSKVSCGDLYMFHQTG